MHKDLIEKIVKSTSKLIVVECKDGVLVLQGKFDVLAQNTTWATRVFKGDAEGVCLKEHMIDDLLGAVEIPAAQTSAELQEPHPHEIARWEEESPAH